ncbi:DUF1631 family protein [Ideonella sp. DXS29W]|uniref:DUF1631 family protein n=1 Tax=Ideonella lacteola TaxID=2984193 RepID=A0ABU9BV25_9BURK
MSLAPPSGASDARDPSSASAEQATLLRRYLDQCQSDAAALLTQVCREASSETGGKANQLWLTPAQRQARQELPRLAPAWMAHLSRPVTPQAPPATAPMPFLASGFNVPSGLSLMSDDDVDEDIESTRVVQAIEGAAEWSLRDLRSRLASGSTSGPPQDDAFPLGPEKVVGALCATLHEAGLDGPMRLAALRSVAEPLARGLADLYQQHAALLGEWGLQPARFTIRREPAARAAAGSAGREVAASRAADAVGVATNQIPALLAQVAGEAGLSSGMQALMNRLAVPVARSVAEDQRLLDSVDNPLWRLIDRLASLGQLDTQATPGSLQLPLHLRLEPIIARLEAAVQPMPVERYSQALAEAEAEAHQVADVHGHTGATTATSTVAPTTPLKLSTSTAPLHASPTAAAVAAERQRLALEPMMRAQMAARLRDDPVLPEVRQFLLGPWLQVLVKAMAEQGEEAPLTQRVLGAVESFINGGSYRRRAPLGRAEMDCLRMEAEDGLLQVAQMPGDRVQQHVLDLRRSLATWPRPVPDTEISALLDEPEETPAIDEQADWPSHHELATVPIALDAHNPDERSMRDCESWLDGLATGDICRIQRQGQWATLRLNWRNDNGTYFAFGNSTGLAFCTSRRVLGRMRLEGLATTMARGQWLRQAVDTLPMALE